MTVTMILCLLVINIYIYHCQLIYASNEYCIPSSETNVHACVEVVRYVGKT